jgi:hypothetical protein
MPQEPLAFRVEREAVDTAHETLILHVHLLPLLLSTQLTKRVDDDTGDHIEQDDNNKHEEGDMISAQHRGHARTGGGVRPTLISYGFATSAQRALFVSRTSKREDTATKNRECCDSESA